MKKHLLSIVACCIFAGGCTTYHLSTQSLLEQFAAVQTERKTIVLIMPPFVFFPGSVQGNNLQEIDVLDKENREHTLPVTFRTGIRITQNSGKKTTFYFNTLLLKDSTITGSKTHFFNAKIKPIRFVDINKIEMQK